MHLDLGDMRAIERLFDIYKPDVVIHLAAITDPDRCEEDRARALRVNFEATEKLARLSVATGAQLIFASTDLVFDGARGDYTETDEAQPLGTYGMSKLRAEHVVLRTCPRAFVFRSSLIYGFGSPTGSTFLTSVIENLEAGKPVKLFTDQIRNPILIDDLTEAVIRAIGLDLAGLFHVAGPEAVSRLDFGRLVCREFGFDQGLLRPIAMEDFGYTARRPLNSTLSTAKFTAATGFTPMGVAEGLRKLADFR